MNFYKKLKSIIVDFLFEPEAELPMQLDKPVIKTEAIIIDSATSTKIIPMKTREELEKMTKLQIDVYAEEECGIKLDRRKTHQHMIDELLNN